MDDWDDFDDEPDYGDDDSVETIVCPNCRADVYEEAEQCPSCGEYIVAGSQLVSPKPLWWLLLGLAGILATIFMLL